MTLHLPFDNAYVRLPERFYAPATPQPVPAPELLHVNLPLAAALGLDGAEVGSAVDVWAGNRWPEGAAPVALAYAGHQFGGFSPRLGDGRAVLLGQLRDPGGQSWDLQLKGSGPTAFSRGGDGRAWVGPVLREYVVSEAMHALGVPTTRALVAVSTGATIQRETELPGAVLTRVARSHVRIGTFEYFGARRDVEGLNALLAYVFDHDLPDVNRTDAPALALLDEVARRQAELVAQWMGFGFLHGVMNTDNVCIVGDTLDYGPCAFLDVYEPDKVFSSIDRDGRYAYDNQPAIAQWNLAALARALVPVLPGDADLRAAQALIDAFPERMAAAMSARFAAKLGLSHVQPGDDALVADLLKLMALHEADFTNTFRSLCHLDASTSPADEGLLAVLGNAPAASAWVTNWRARLALESATDAERQARMRQVNPAYIARNHRIEAMIQAAVHGDLAPLDRLLAVVRSPFEERAYDAEYALPPQTHEVVHATFCGT